MLDAIFAHAHFFVVKGSRADAEEGRVVGQRIKDLAVGNAPCHHNVSDCVGFREHVLDALAAPDVPVRYVVGLHVCFPLVPVFAFAAGDFAFTDVFHDVEAFLAVDALADQIGHDVVTGTDSRGDGCFAFFKQRLGIADPHVCSVGQAGDTNQIGKGGRLRIDKHLHGEVGTEFRDT